MDKEVQSLRKQKSCVKGKLTKIANFAKAVSDETSVSEIQSRLDRCHTLLKEFNDFDMKIIMLNPEEDGDLTFEDDYHMTVAMLTTWIRKRSIADQVAPQLADQTLNLNTSQFNFGAETELKLPKINIPKFTGNYIEWPSFFDLYTKTIHESKRLSQAQKFQYLKGLLDGEAAALLRHILVTENNYSTALAKLKDRYDRKRHIVTAFIKKFVSQPSIPYSSASTLRKMMDTSDEVVRGLEALGKAAESRDAWLIYLLIDKLDDESRTAWAHHSTDLEAPTFTDFLKFLSRRIDALETASSNSKRSGTRNEARSHVAAQSETAPSTVRPEAHLSTCGYCASQQHSLLQCNEFLALDVNKRRVFIRDKHRCYNCLSITHSVSRCPNRGRCRTCKRRHHTLLHLNETASNCVAVTEDSPTQQSEVQAVTAVCSYEDKCLAILPTVSLNVENSTGGFTTCRALMDSGSQLSLITNACVQRLNLAKQHSNMLVSGVGHCVTERTRGIVQLKVKAENKHKLHMLAFILPRITGKLPAQSIDFDINKNDSVKLADPMFNTQADVDILIGSDYLFEILRDGTKRIQNTHLFLKNTIFGWVVAGRNTHQANESDECLALPTIGDLMELDTTLKKFWEVESVGNDKIILSPEETLCEEHFVNHTTRDINGRFIVSLPMKSPVNNLGNSFNIALQRFRALEHRLSQQPELKDSYINFMQEYISLGHMVEVPVSQTAAISYYLPHHGVFKSTDVGKKLRIVFDGSAQPSDGRSLNSCLAVGPKVQASLFNILLRFRERKYVFSSDIEKMYRQIKIAESDSDLQRIIWRESSSSPLRHYNLRTVTYGLSSSPFLATRALKQIAIDIAEHHPDVAVTINECIYVDDIMTGADTQEEALLIRDGLINILSQYGFQLKKWKANCTTLLSDIPIDHWDIRDKPFSAEPHSSMDTVKVLGVRWNPINDQITFNVQLPEHSNHTKRTALSDASRLFDPLGWMAPVVVRMKIFVQHLWMKNLGWDDPLPVNLRTEWLTLRDDLLEANSIIIPRHIHTIRGSVIEMHGFSDASKLAYAAAVYFRVTNGSKTVVQLITAKTKVAPTKQLSIPKLELSGALLLSQLMNNVLTETRITVSQIHAWTDSKDVLDWLSDHPSKWSTFIGNRTAEILNIVSRSCWKHVPSEDNPADCASRGLSPKALRSLSMWWQGPQWLSYSLEKWPIQSISERIAIGLHTSPPRFVLMHNQWLDQLIKKYSSFKKLQLVICYIKRFISNAQKPKILRNSSVVPESDEFLNILYLICRYEQQLYFSKEIHALRNGTQISNRSMLIALNPFLDKNDVLRVGGRLANSEGSYDTKHPIIVHTNSNITQSILRDIHLQYKHAGISLLMNITRQTFWIPSLRNKVKYIIRNCVVCQRNKAALRTQIMADLPRSRVIASNPFTNCGVDYAGPFNFHLIKGRGQKTYQGYICLFVCLTIKAVHIEFANDLTSEGFLGALRRFVARRGVPTTIFSDNGRNFVGAEAKLKQTFQSVVRNSTDVQKFSTAAYIKWNFNPPLAPHFGGLWESAVKSTKFHLKRVIGNTILTLEEMVTLLTEIEGILSSRPLCTTSEPNIDMLTPSHFLLGHSNVKIPEKDLTEVKCSYLNRWQMVQKLTQHFWERWHSEYLTTLQTRVKWRKVGDSVRVNDVVILHEKHVPACKWPLGRILEVHPGPDGYIHIKYIHKICVLPVSQPDNETSRDAIHPDEIQNPGTSTSASDEDNIISLAAQQSASPNIARSMTAASKANIT